MTIRQKYYLLSCQYFCNIILIIQSSMNSTTMEFIGWLCYWKCLN